MLAIETGKLKTGFIGSPTKSSRNACPVSTSTAYADSFDLQVYCEYNATPASKTHMSTTDGVCFWDYISSGFFWPIGLYPRLTCAYYKSGNNATLGDYQTSLYPGTNPYEEDKIIANDDATLMNRGYWNFQAEITGSLASDGASLMTTELYYYDEGVPAIRLHRSPSTLRPKFSTSPENATNQFMLEVCFPFAAALAMGAPTASGHNFTARLRGYREGTTANF